MVVRAKASESDTFDSISAGLGSEVDIIMALRCRDLRVSFSTCRVARANSSHLLLEFAPTSVPGAPEPSKSLEENSVRPDGQRKFE